MQVEAQAGELRIGEPRRPNADVGPGSSIGVAALGDPRGAQRRQARGCRWSPPGRCTARTCRRRPAADSSPRRTTPACRSAQSRASARGCRRATLRRRSCAMRAAARRQPNPPSHRARRTGRWHSWCSPRRQSARGRSGSGGVLAFTLPCAGIIRIRFQGFALTRRTQRAGPLASACTLRHCRFAGNGGYAARDPSSRRSPDAVRHPRSRTALTWRLRGGNPQKLHLSEVRMAMRNLRV